MQTNYTVIENPISDFEQIELEGDQVNTVEHRETPEELKASLPDYNPGTCHVATAAERASYQRNPAQYKNRPVTAGARRSTTR